MVMIKTKVSDGSVAVFDTSDVRLAVENIGGRYQPAGGTKLWLKGHEKLELIIEMDIETYAAIACAGFEHVETAAKLVS